MAPRAKAPAQANTLDGTFGQPIKQYAGQVQVTRAVKVKAPGKHFTGLTGSEAQQEYWAEAVEYKERHAFDRHVKAWGAAHTGPGIRFICESDALDDPEHRGFWTTLGLWNRWRHETYKDNRQEELQYLDELAPVLEPEDAAPAAAKNKADGPEIRTHFTAVREGTHTVGGTGKMAGQTVKAVWFACNKPGCARGVGKPIKQVGTATGEHFGHLDVCQPALALRLRAQSSHSPVRMGEDGEMYSIYTFDELLPHHIRYVIKCFRGFDHFYETRADNGLLEYIQGFDKRASLPHQQTCLQILEVRALPHLPHPPVPKPCTVRPRWLTPACTFSSVFIYNKPTNSNALGLDSPAGWSGPGGVAHHKAPLRPHLPCLR